MIQGIQKFLYVPTSTSLDTREYSIRNIDFPGVTICPNSKIMKSSFRAAMGSSKLPWANITNTMDKETAMEFHYSVLDYLANMVLFSGNPAGVINKKMPHWHFRYKTFSTAKQKIFNREIFIKYNFSSLSYCKGWGPVRFGNTGNPWRETRQHLIAVENGGSGLQTDGVDLQVFHQKCRVCLCFMLRVFFC